MKKYIYITGKDHYDVMFSCDNIVRVEVQDTIVAECNQVNYWLTFSFDDEANAVFGRTVSVECLSKNNANETLKKVVKFLENDYMKILHIEKEIV